MKKRIGASVIVLTLVVATLVLLAIHVLHVNPLNPTKQDKVMVGKLEREFSYHVPVEVVKNAKLIFVIHGSSGTPLVMQISTGHCFDLMADVKSDAIIVYPAGYHKFWNDCRKMATYDAKKENTDDVAFFGAMIKYFKEKYNIDTTEVFAVGYSNGGQMCYKLAKEKPQWFKGIAAIAANLPVEENNDCYETHLPVSVLVMNGTADPFNPYNGGEVIVGDGQKRGSVISTDQTIQYWLNNDSCSLTPFSTYNFPDIDTTDNSVATWYLYNSATTGKKVELIKVMNGGHLIPNPNFTYWPKAVGNVNKDINAPKIIWDFFHEL